MLYLFSINNDQPKNFYRKIRIVTNIGAYNNRTTSEIPIDNSVVMEYIIGSGCAVDARGAHSRRSSCVGSFFTTSEREVILWHRSL